MTVCIDSPAFSESKQLKAFATDRTDDPDLLVEITSSGEIQIPPGFVLREADREVYRNGGTESVIIRDLSGEILWRADYDGTPVVRCVVSPSMAKNLNTFSVIEIAELPRFLLRRGGVILHASFISYRGEAILFTAKKQTGKSTQARLWNEYCGAEIINGDRALLKYADGQLFACGVPFCGTSGISKNACLPVKAVIILSQAKQNIVRRASPVETEMALISGCTFDNSSPAGASEFFSLADKISASAPFYTFGCLPDCSAVETLKNTLYI